MPQVVLKPYGGLGNRILAINATINLCLYLNYDAPVVIWEKNSDLNAGFWELFEHHSYFKILETRAFNWINPSTYLEVYNIFPPSHYKYPLLNKLLGREKRYNIILYDNPDEKIPFDLRLIKDMKQHESLYIAKYYEYFSGEKKYLELKPVKEIQLQIDAIVKQFDQNTVGFHIRRTDNELSIMKSPDELFFEKAEELLYQNYRIFLATDCAKTRNSFIERFGEAIFVNPNFVAERNSLEGMQQALVDFYCLSRSQKIFGSFNSTFSETASRAQNIPLEILKKG